MNISAPFVHRPIATALLMLGLLLGGLVTYRLLPVAALPNVNFPTIQVTAQLPGADPQTMASSVATPLEQQFSQIPGLVQLTSSNALGFTQLTVQFALNRNIDSAATDVLAAINAASPYLPQGIPYLPDHPQGEPGGDADPRLRIDVRHAAVDDGRRLRGKHSGAENLADRGRRYRRHRRPAEAGDPGSARPPSACQSWHRPGGRPQRPDAGQCRPAKGHLEQPKADLHPEYQRSVAQARSLQKSDRRLPQWLAGPPPGRRQRHRRAREQSAGRLVQQQSRHHPGRAASARRKRDRHGRSHPGAAAATAGVAAAGHQDQRHFGPDPDRSRLGLRRAVHALADRGTRRDGDLRLASQFLGDRHSRRHRAAVAHRHVRRPLRTGVQPGQSLPDGALDRDRLRGGRRGRRNREHRPPRRGRPDPDGGRAAGIARDRIYHRVDHALADRRVHPPVPDGRLRRRASSRNSPSPSACRWSSLS
ncbi:hypothetical protein ACVWZV_001034 [Bradyrhizobium sp. GM5.1]